MGSPVQNSARILIIKPSSLGDVATTLPMLCDLHDAFPAAKIDWLIHPSLTAVIEGHEAIHELIAFDRKRLGAWWYRPSACKLFLGLLGTLRRNRYDIVIDAQGLFRSAFLARYTGARIRIGFASAREGAPLAYTHKVRLAEDGKQMLSVDRMRALLGPLEIDITRPAHFRMPLSQAAGEAVDKAILNSQFGRRNSFVVIVPGARWDTKRWDIGRYTELTRNLLDAGEAVLLAGSANEKPLCDRIQTDLESRGAKGENLRNVAGMTTLAEMIVLLARAKLVIGNDSGPVHVAAALHRPTLSIYGPTAPAFVGPYGQMENVLRHQVWCHPCRLRECDHHSCMKGVTVEMAWEKTRQLLDVNKTAETR